MKIISQGEKVIFQKEVKELFKKKKQDREWVNRKQVSKDHSYIYIIIFIDQREEYWKISLRK